MTFSFQGAVFMKFALLPVIAAVFMILAAHMSHAGEIPAAGQPAPAFSLMDQAQHPHALKDYIGKWVVLYFYPKDDTPGCTKEACSFRDDLAQLEKLGAKVIGVSVDDSDSHAKFASKYH
jgi:peroxiredoxin Q/BCP